MKLDEIRKNIIETYLNKWVTPDWDSGKGWTIEKDGSVNIQGGITIRDYSGSSLPFKIKHVAGNLTIVSDLLTSLEGCPKKVGGCFNITSNSLKNLKGSPKTVLGDYYIRCNSLESLDGIATKIGRNLLYQDLDNIPVIDLDMLIKQDCKLDGEITKVYSTSGMSGISGSIGTSGPGPCPVGHQGTPGYQGIQKSSQQKVYIAPISKPFSKDPIFESEVDHGIIISSIINFKKKITKILNFIWSKR